MAWGSLLGAGYGLWTVCVHLVTDLDWSTWLASAAWLMGLFMAVGSILVGLVALAAILVGRCFHQAHRSRISALVETMIWFPLVLWLVLNEFVYLLTTEVVGTGTIQLVWQNTAAVFQNAWAMAAGYLVGTGVIALVAAGLIYYSAAKSFRRLIEAICRKDTGPSASSPARTWQWAFPIPGGLIILLALLVWSLHPKPSEALIVTCRSAPPLRAFNLVQMLSRENLRGPVPERFGSAVITESQYVSIMGSPRNPAPNVVFLLLESTPATALHCYGHPYVDVSPNLDRLAAEGTRFGHCVAPSSFSSCSVVSIATSLYMMRGPRFDYFANITYPFLTWQRALKLAGYELALFSSGNETFDNINSFCRPADFETYFSQDTCPIPQPDCMRMDDRIAVEEFEKWISKRTDKRPFYCGFYLQSPHFNYEIPEPWASYYQPIPPLYSNGSGILHIPPDVLPQLKNQYANAIRYMDYWIGRILNDLDKAGVLGRTIIVATGDHGEAFMEHGLARHGVHTWEEMIHTPLIIWAGPEVRASLSEPLPSVVTETVSGLDIAPTIAGLVGIPPYPGWQGVNALAPGYSDDDRPVFSMTQYTRWQETVCVDRIKYIYDLTDAMEFLFDLQTDPGERSNLARRMPELASTMRTLLGGWHTWQLTYYEAPGRSEYVGSYVPNPATLDFVHRAARELRASSRAE